MLSQDMKYQRNPRIEQYIRLLSTADNQAFEALVAAGETAFPALTAALLTAETSETTRLLILSILGQLSPAALPICDLVKFLKTGPSREATALISHALRPVAASVLSQLIDLLQDSDSSVRRAAAEVIGDWGPEIAYEAVPSLIESLHTAKIPPELAAARALQRMGREAEAMIPEDKIDVYQYLIGLERAFAPDASPGFGIDQSQRTESSSISDSIISNPPPVYCNIEGIRRLLWWKCP